MKDEILVIVDDHEISAPFDVKRLKVSNDNKKTKINPFLKTITIISLCMFILYTNNTKTAKKYELLKIFLITSLTINIVQIIFKIL